MSNGKQKTTLNASEMAREVGVSVSYIARLCREGRIAAEKVGGVVWTIERQEVLRWIDEEMM
jgi:excisionase family DNA binding protein